MLGEKISLNCRNRQVMLSALVEDMTALPLQSLKPQAISLHWLFTPHENWIQNVIH